MKWRGFSYKKVAWNGGSGSQWGEEVHTWVQPCARCQTRGRIRRVSSRDNGRTSPAGCQSPSEVGKTLSQGGGGSNDGRQVTYWGIVRWGPGFWLPKKGGTITEWEETRMHPMVLGWNIFHQETKNCSKMMETCQRTQRSAWRDFYQLHWEQIEHHHRDINWLKHTE